MPREESLYQDSKASRNSGRRIEIATSRATVSMVTGAKQQEQLDRKNVRLRIMKQHSLPRKSGNKDRTNGQN